MKDNLKRSAIETLKIIGICILAYPAGIILMLLLGGNADLAISLPFVSGFIHHDIAHFLFNIVSLFFLLIYTGNKYNLKQMVLITFLIQCFCFIVSLFGVLPSVGISGLVYFLATRYLIKFNKITLVLFFILLLGEALSLNDPDGISHWGHLIGIFFGFVSLNINHYRLSNILPRKLLQVIHSIFLPR